MFSSYLKTAWRNLLGSPVYMITNIGGLALAFLCVMLITLYVEEEVNFDKFHNNGRNIFRVVHDARGSDGKEVLGGTTSGIEADVFKREIPEIIAAGRFQGGEDQLILKDNHVFVEKVDYADQNFLDMFSFKIDQHLAGKALDGWNNAVITRDIAIKYFGHENALGKTLVVRQDGKFENFIISGIAEPTPGNSSIRFKILLPIGRRLQHDFTMRWFTGILNTFVLLRSPKDVVQVEKKMQAVFENHAKQQIEQIRSQFGNFSYHYKIQPLYEIHFDDKYNGGNGVTNFSDPLYSVILSNIALFILFIACVNFVNQTLGRGYTRGKEIGIRKVLGGMNRQIVWQFISETLVINLLSFVIAFIVLLVGLSSFSHILHKELTVSSLFDIRSLLLFLTMIVLNTLLTGIYPSFVVSKFNPIEVLRYKLKLSGKNRMGKGLIVTQFIIAIALIVATIVMKAQLHYVSKMDLGFNSSGVLNIELPPDNKADIISLKNELLKYSYIKDVSCQSISVTSENQTDLKVDDKILQQIPFFKVDDDFLHLMGIQLIAGRNFNHHSDSASCIISNAFVQKAGWQNALGKRVEWNGRSFTVIGVIRDFHAASLKSPVTPIFLHQAPFWSYGKIAIKIDPANKAAAMKTIEHEFSRAIPLYPFNYRFLDDMITDQYESEARWNLIISLSAMIAIAISCVGLFGLVSLSVEQRVKEIGIRKTMGATSFDLGRLFLSGFAILVLIAVVIAIPASYYIMSKWLQSFAYRIELQSWMFILAGLIIMLIALATAGLRIIRVIKTNPAKILKVN
jgi:putative ABC transport system permease protein